MKLYIKDNLVIRFIETINTKLFFLLLLLFYCAFIFQGIDFSDEGFHSTFYQQIYSDPESVRHNFGLWLSGIIGGAWWYLFSKFGLLGLRLGGVIIFILTAIVSYNFLKNYINRTYLKLGLLLIVLLNGIGVKDINYNNLSALFFVFIIVFFVRGLMDRNLFSLFIAGSFLSFATFTRIPSASGLSLLLVIIYSGFFIIRQQILYQLKQVAFFLAGFAIFCVAFITLMKVLGHYSVFRSNLDVVSNMAESDKSEYQLGKLIKVLIMDYLKGMFKWGAPVIVLILLGSSLLNRVKTKLQIRKILYFFFLIGSILLFLGLIYLNGTSEIWLAILLAFAAMALVTAIMINLTKGNEALKIISLAGVFMTVCLVAGSNYGMVASGSTTLWVGFPVAVAFLGGISKLSINSAIEVDNRTNNNQSLKIPLSVTPDQLRVSGKWVLYFCVIFLIFYSITYTYNDNPNRAKMTYSIKSPFLKGIFTTKERATAVNELLEQSSKYLKKGDYVLAYEDLPMFYAMTGTKPYVKNSWLRLYSRDLLDHELKQALVEKKNLPVVIYQKVTTLPSPYWPDLKQDNSGFDIDALKNAPIKNFLANNKYKLVWENIAFRIYIP